MVVMGVQRTLQRGWQGLEGEQAQGSEGPLSPPNLKTWLSSSASSSFLTSSCPASRASWRFLNSSQFVPALLQPSVLT